MLRLFVIVSALGLSVCRAEPYWVRYEAASGLFPEKAGWTRYSSEPPAQRWLEDGKLFIDSRADWFIYEDYGMSLPGMMTLAPGETFVMRWRVKIDEIIGYSDPGVGVLSDNHDLINLSMGLDFIELAYGESRAPFAPCRWHEFALVSSDLLNYQLYVDGAFGFSAAALDEVYLAPGASWGDMSSHRSLSQWDYVEFGIVPEPSGGWLVLIGTCVACLLKRTAGRRGRLLVA